MMKSPAGIRWLAALFADPTKKIVGHNFKYDLEKFYQEGIDIFAAKAEVHCTMILAKCLNGMMPNYDLLWLTQYFLGRDTADKTAITDWLKANAPAFREKHGREPNFSDAPIDLVSRRAMWDTESTFLLFHFLYPKVQKICPRLYKTERQLQLVVADMELTGVRVDITHARMLRARARAGIKRIQAELDRLCCPFSTFRPKKRRRGGVPYIDTLETVHEQLNVNSNQYELPAVFEKLGITLRYKTQPKKGKKGGKKTGGGRWSFDEYSMVRYVSPSLGEVIRDSGEEGWPYEKWWAAVQEVIQTNHLHKSEWLPPLILKLRELQKMVNTYYGHIINEAVDVKRDPVTGRETGILHCKFNQNEAMTGRFSSSEPNLQNMPRILGPRECFIPRNGLRHFHFDYEQVEMRFFCHLAEDPDMAEAIADDIHLFVASEIYGIPIDKVTKEQRKRAKQINFGILYGSGAEKVAETLTRMGLPTSTMEASLLFTRYHRRFPSIRRVTQEYKKFLIEHKYIENLYGRRYYLNTRDGYKGLNYVCQGSPADLMKQAMVKIWRWLRRRGLRSKILIQVHDELVVQIPRNEEAEVVPKIVELMQDLTSFYVPITVGVEVSKSRWSHKEEFVSKKVA